VAALAAGVVLAACSSSSSSSTTTTTSPTLSTGASVLSPAYARGLGFTKVIQAPKSGKVTDEKGCTSSVEAVYENVAAKTGLISDALNCSSASAAAKALATARKSATLDTAIVLPHSLGSSAFVSSSQAPEYLVAWQAGSRVGITAYDVNTAASSTTTAAKAPISAAQVAVLTAAAAHQNAGY
jgi:hypothetical protein